MSSNVLKTQFGNAKINADGYYHITSRKEGNCLKLLHRLIWETFYNTKIPKGYVIHHKNGNKRDNCILNLQLLKQEIHSKHHSTGENNPFYGKHHTQESKRKIGISRCTTGFYRVSKCYEKGFKQGFRWVYQYTDNNGKKHKLSSVNFNKLKQKVIEKGLEWKKLN